VTRDDVDFAVPRAVAALENCVPAPPQFIARQRFAQFSQGLPSIAAHGDRQVQEPGRAA
jgi:hypothetical protein